MHAGVCGAKPDTGGLENYLVVAAPIGFFQSRRA
jgi:hypothetical protein